MPDMWCYPEPPEVEAAQTGGYQRDDPTVLPVVWRGLDGQMITDTKEIAKRLRTEADYWRDYNEEDTIFTMSDCRFTESVLIAFGMDDMDIYADMPVCELFDKLADFIDPQSS